MRSDPMVAFGVRAAMYLLLCCNVAFLHEGWFVQRRPHVVCICSVVELVTSMTAVHVALLRECSSTLE